MALLNELLCACDALLDRLPGDTFLPVRQMAFLLIRLSLLATGCFSSLSPPQTSHRRSSLR